MCTESDQTAINRASCLLNMNDTQNQNNFDFVPKSDYNEKWHLENKCLFHNQQFLEGDKCETNKLACPVSCDLCLHFREKYKSKRSGSTLNQKSGDWKSDENIVKNSLKCIVQEPSITEWRWKNPYSVSDFDRSKHWSRRNFTSESCGVPRTEYSFSTLINTMGRATGQSLLALLYVMLNVIPVIEVFLHLLRFVLDKVISISNSKDFRQTITRCLVFTTELFSVYICLIFIFGFIVLPIVHMVIDIIAKIMLYN
ncbi:hypothetical protein WN51_11021 [Melipona quadrifasciata]|uniref:Uncharacterized protein n=1 Tax=Melipona quadrifasciata TaxID=166423 RepID=A0A0N0BHS7_9HYME|nr:hypothetical protein WN51_11021 [Melipona quadrifasciata]